MLQRVFWVGFVALMLVACAYGGKSGEPAKPTWAKVEVAEPWYGDLHALVEEAAHARGVRFMQTFEIVLLDVALFLELFRSFA